MKKPVDVEAQKAALKALILLGKNRGYLLMIEIRDHFPDVVDAEQLESISETFSDMGIAIRESHPD